MEFPEFLEASLREVVEWFFRPVHSSRIVELFDEVQDSFVVSSTSFDQGYNFLDIVFLTVFNVVGFS